MKKLMAFLAVLLAGVVCAAAQAGPRIVLPTDADGADIRAVAEEFLRKIDDGDVAGTKALFAGSVEQEHLLEAQFRYVAAAKNLAKALADRFGSNETAKMAAVASYFRQRSTMQAGMPIMRNGDSACIAAGDILDDGLDLQRIAGNWKVTHLLIEHRRTEGFQDFYASAARDFDEARAMLDAGGFDSSTSAIKDIDRRATKTLTKISSVPTLPATRPSTGPPSPALPMAFAEAAAVQASFGKLLDSEENKALIAALPGTPRLMVKKGGLFICSYESGMTLAFRATDGAFMGASFYRADARVNEKYPGALPSGLSFDDTRIDIERKLGRPTTSYGGGTFPYEADYPRLGLHLTYARPSGKDPRNPLDRVYFRAPDPTAAAATEPAESASPRLTFQLVVPEPKAGDPAVLRIVDPADVSGRSSIFVSREAVLDESAISEVSGAPTGRNHDHIGIALGLTPEGARRMEQVSAENKGRKIAIMLDGRALVVPTMNGKMSDRIMIDLNIPIGSGDREDLIGQIDAAVNALPTPKPSAGGANK